MAVFRVHKTIDFTTVSTHHLRNKEIGLKAKGLLTLMLSLPDNWDYSVMGLAALSKDGKDSVMSALNELSNAGYISIESFRNDKGQYESIYNVYESPDRENRCGKSASVNPPQYNIININNNTPLSLFPDVNKEIPQGGESKSDDGFDAAWIAYGRKGNKQAALRYWRKLSPKDRKAIMDTIPLYIAANPDEKFRKDFSGWINPTYRRWENKIVDANPQQRADDHVFRIAPEDNTPKNVWKV